MIDFNFDILQSSRVIGIDEVGRGAWAGPVYAGAALLSYKNSYEIPKEINDSKKLNQIKRLKILNEIKLKSILSIGSVGVSELDKIGLQNAVWLAMEKALNNLNIKKNIENYLIIIDGNVPPVFSKKNLNIKLLINGDNISPSIAAASIFAKIKRDEFMATLNKIYPGYNFNKNMGYGTREHILAIEKFGTTQEHRMSFKPIKNFMNKFSNH